METLRVLESIRSPILDAVFSVITSLGEETVVMVAICAIFWCVNKRIAYGVGVAFFFSGMIIQGMKICFRIDRPWIVDPTLKPAPSALKTATGYSFPSGHTQSAATLFGSLGMQIRQKPIKALCFAAVILVAFSRLYLGVHTPLDVAVALLISFFAIMLEIKIVGDGLPGKKRELTISVIMALFAAIVAAIAAVMYLSGTIERGYAADCLKAAGGGIGFAAGMFVERIYIDFSEKAKNILWQAIKLAVGLAGTLAIKEGLKLVLWEGLASDMIRYFLMTTWVTVFFPLIIKRFFAVKE
ncbi:MAG: phosphatase PAP2 family protein [Oscillospiraceae bacterium]|nr:phosphatase PAP2 family protein [Oscillospiraceae bacterium]